MINDSPTESRQVDSHSGVADKFRREVHFSEQYMPTDCCSKCCSYPSCFANPPVYGGSSKFSVHCSSCNERSIKPESQENENLCEQCSSRLIVGRHEKMLNFIESQPSTLVQLRKSIKNLENKERNLSKKKN